MSANDVYLMVGPVQIGFNEQTQIADFLFKQVKEKGATDFVGFFYEHRAVQHQFIMDKPRERSLADYRRFVNMYWKAFAQELTLANGKMVFQTICWKRDRVLPKPLREDHPDSKYQEACKFNRAADDLDFTNMQSKQLLDWIAKSTAAPYRQTMQSLSYL